MLKSGLLEIGIEGRARLLAEEPIETQFEVEKQPFARGKFAAVRRAFRREDSTTFAAKYVRKRRRVGPEEIWHEVCVLWKSRDCPFIVHLFQVFETPLDTILILELAEGGDLQTLLDSQEEECLEERLCVDVLRDTLKGILFLHDHSVAHLDIKPANLLVVPGALPLGRVKICDFGLSRYISTATEVRELFGTTEYMSPEVLSYEPIGLSVDAWAVGVLTYVLLSGRLPFGGDTKQETYLNISTGALTFPSDHFQHVSIQAIDFIRNLLLLEPSERLTAEQALRHDWFKSTTSVFHMAQINKRKDESRVARRRCSDTEEFPCEETPTVHHLSGRSQSESKSFPEEDRSSDQPIRNNHTPRFHQTQPLTT